MAFRKHVMLAFALLTLIAIALGCADDTTAPTQENEAPVLAPTNVQAVVMSGGDIRVSWSPSSQPNVAGYNVYRLDDEVGVIGRLNPSRIAATSYVDATALPLHVYEYRVTAVSTTGRESRFAAVTIQNVIGDRNSGTPTD